jgi:hypothetical protein
VGTATGIGDAEMAWESVKILLFLFGQSYKLLIFPD